MSGSTEHTYTGRQFLDSFDDFRGSLRALDDSTGVYVAELGDYIQGINEGNEPDKRDLSDAIYDVKFYLEDVFTSIESLDEMVSDEHMIARVRHDGEPRYCDLERSLEGSNRSLESFRDLVFLSHCLESQDFKADTAPGRQVSVSPGAPTVMVDASSELLDAANELEQQYDRLISAEVLARRHLETDNIMQPYAPEPPIYSMLGQVEHEEHVRELNNRLK